MSKVAFVHWYEPDDYYHWNDGLRAALRILGEKHEIHSYTDTVDKRLLETKYDVVMAWGGSLSPEAGFLKALDHPRKILLYAGGPLDRQHFEGINLVVIENELDRIEGTRTKLAFGTNTELFRMQKSPTLWDGILPAAYAEWKRQALFADALGSKGLLCGPKQEIETHCFKYPEERGCLVLPNVNQEILPYLYSSSYATVITATRWGGCQRAILEGMACGIPTIVMSDAPKNAWYVMDSGMGFIVEPNPEAIKEAIHKIKQHPWSTRQYVLENWSEKKYAKGLDEALQSVF